jgi:hypothetical protein
MATYKDLNGRYGFVGDEENSIVQIINQNSYCAGTRLNEIIVEFERPILMPNDTSYFTIISEVEEDFDGELTIPGLPPILFSTRTKFDPYSANFRAIVEFNVGTDQGPIGIQVATKNIYYRDFFNAAIAEVGFSGDGSSPFSQPDIFVYIKNNNAPESDTIELLITCINLTPMVNYSIGFTDEYGEPINVLGDILPQITAMDTVYQLPVTITHSQFSGVYPLGITPSIMAQGGVPF